MPPPPAPIIIRNVLSDGWTVASVVVSGVLGLATGILAFFTWKMAKRTGDLAEVALRDQQQRDTDRQEAQARRIAFWTGEWKSANGRFTCNVHVRNGSEQPVKDWGWHLRYAETTNYIMECYWEDGLGPGGEQTSPVDIPWEPARLQGLAVDAYFRDASSVRWILTRDGVLLRDPNQSPGRRDSYRTT